MYYMCVCSWYMTYVMCVCSWYMTYVFSLQHRMPTDLRLGSKTEHMLTDLNDRLQIWTLPTKQTKQPSIQNKYGCMGSQIKKNTTRFHSLWIIGKELCLPFYDRNIFSIEHSCWFGCTCFKQKVKVYIDILNAKKNNLPLGAETTKIKPLKNDWRFINMIDRLGSYMMGPTFSKLLPTAHLHLRRDLSPETSKNTYPVS